MEVEPKKEVVQELKVESANVLLSKVKNQLLQLKKNEPKKEVYSGSDSEEDEEDEAMLADLVKKKKENEAKKAWP